MSEPHKDWDAARWVEALSLVPHPEGGFYRETQRSSRCTNILYLLPSGRFSRWHRVRGADETWHHYGGDPLSLWVIGEDGPREIRLGGPVGAFHAVVPADVWQAAQPSGSEAGYSLVGCTVAPPFSFDRFEIASPGVLQDWCARWSDRRDRMLALS